MGELLRKASEARTNGSHKCRFSGRTARRLQRHRLPHPRRRSGMGHKTCQISATQTSVFQISSLILPWLHHGVIDWEFASTFPLKPLITQIYPLLLHERKFVDDFKRSSHCLGRTVNRISNMEEEANVNWWGTYLFGIKLNCAEYGGI